MVDKFLTFAKERHLVKRGDSILLAVSGGIDSVVMLDLFVQARESLNLRLAVAHVNYGLREESDADELFVRKLAKKYSLPVFIKKQKLTGPNIEERARNIRYDFFAETAETEGYDKIAVAHHKNDLAETLLLNIIRGTGLSGLTPMKVRRGKLIRPLLWADRAIIVGYAKDKILEFSEDKSNKDVEFSRNRIRHNILPEIERINPRFLETAARETALFDEIETFFEGLVKELMPKTVKFDNKRAEVDLNQLNTVPDILKRFFYRTVIEEISGLNNIDSRNIDDLLNISSDTSGSKEIQLPNGLMASRIYDRMVIGLAAKKALPKRKKANAKNLSLGKNHFENHIITLEKANGISPKSEQNLVEIDYEKTGPLLVRFKSNGDRVAIGQGKTKKLQDIFTDEKIPKQLRETIPIITTRDGEIVWACKVRKSEKFKATPSTNNILRIKFEEKN